MISQTIPVSDELKEAYLAQKRMIQVKIYKGFDPFYTYYVFNIPEASSTEKVIRLAARAFEIPQLEAVLINSTGDAIVPCQTILDTCRRFGTTLTVAHLKPIIPVVENYEVQAA